MSEYHVLQDEVYPPTQMGSTQEGSITDYQMKVNSLKEMFPGHNQEQITET